MTAHWCSKSSANKVILPKTPRTASWNKATHPDQIALRTYLADTVPLATPSIPATGPWALWLEVGLPSKLPLEASADLDNYALPLASAVQNERLVSVWCSKRHATASHLVITQAHLTSALLT